MNKQLQAAELARFWKQRRTPDGYVEKLGKDGKVYERVYSPIPKQTTIKKPTQARPQPPKVKPPSQPGYTPTPEQQWIIQQREQALREQVKNQKDWFNLLNENAKEAQYRSFTNNRQVQELINKGNLGVQKSVNEGNFRVEEERTRGSLGVEGLRKESRIEETKLNTTSNEKIAETQATSAGNVAGIQAEASKFGAITAAEASKFGATADAEARNRQTDANYFVEREKNANQKEKNKQDFYLNAGLGILDSMNKQRASSSQAAAQIYSSFLSSNPYNFKYWN
jgi:hypothetical protein